jgi:DNA-binding XRE family transcriptional regulator
MMDLKALKADMMQNADVAAEYEALKPEFALVDEMMRARAEAGLTQADVAKLMGTKQSAVSQIESGGNISLKRLQAYAKAVGREVRISLV